MPSIDTGAIAATDDARTCPAKRVVSARGFAHTMHLADVSAEDLAAIFTPEFLSFANDVDPSVVILPRVKTYGWDGGEYRPLPLQRMPLSVALETWHKTDALAVSYRAGEPYRINKSAIAVAGVEVVVLYLDVDGPTHGTSEPAPDGWYEQEWAKVGALLSRHPGAVVYATKGGYRIVYRLARPVPIACEADELAYAAFFGATVAYLEKDFDIVADPAMAKWGQPCAMPRTPKHAMRGGDILGDPREIGVWSYVPTEDELVAAKGTKGTGARRSPGAVYTGDPNADDPWVARAVKVGLITADLGGGKFAAVCPSRHTKDASDSATVYFNAGAFSCLRGGCEKVKRADFYRAIQAREAAQGSLDDARKKIKLGIGANRPTIVRIPCGVGKSTELRAAASPFIATIVPSHELAREQDTKLQEERGLAYAHHAAVTQLTNQRTACVRKEEADAIAKQGLSVRRLLCPSCPHKDTCEAREEPKGHAPIGPQALARKFTGAPILVFDEQFPLTKSFEISKDDIRLAGVAITKYADKESSTLLLPWYRSIQGHESSSDEVDKALEYANTTRQRDVTFKGLKMRRARKPLTPPRVDPSLVGRELARALADCVHDIGRRDDRTPGSESAAKKWTAAPRYLAALVKVRNAAAPDTKISPCDDGFKVRTFSDCSRVWRSHPAPVLLSATPLEPALRALRPDVDLVPLAVPDAEGLVHRTWVQTSDTHVKMLKADVGRLRHYFDLVVGKAKEMGCKTVLVVVAKTFAERVRGWTVPELTIEVAHYGSVTGIDRWKHFDGFATIGENWSNKIEVEEEALFISEVTGNALDAGEHACSMVEGDLEQAHGRARDPRRTTPAHHWHVGAMAPASWTRENTFCEGAPTGRPKNARTVDAETVRRLVRAAGGARRVAELLGISRATVGKYVNGKCAIPADILSELQRIAAV